MSTPYPWAMPGYDAEVIMAAGAFVQGSSIELSADGPIRPPYAVYFQGGLTWYHAKLGILMSLQKLVDAGSGNTLIQLEIEVEIKNVVLAFSYCPAVLVAAPICFRRSAAATQPTNTVSLKMVIAVGVVMGLHAAY